MATPRTQALVFALGILLAGGAVGFTAERVLRHEDTSVAARRRALYDDLGLSAQQRLRLDEILDARNCRYEAVVSPLRPALDSIRIQTRAQIDRALTPEQRARLDGRRRDDDARRAAERERIQNACRNGRGAR